MLTGCGDGSTTPSSPFGANCTQTTVLSDRQRGPGAGGEDDWRTRYGAGAVGNGRHQRSI